MKRILILGAGFLARPVAGFFHENGQCQVTVASRSPGNAGRIIDGFGNCRADRIDVTKKAELEKRIEDTDIVIGLLPSGLHADVADLCIRHGIPMVTPACACENMKKRNEEARRAGVPILCEMGLAPGIDHMSAMRLIEGIRLNGGRIDSLHSYCGNLPAPEANTNPFGFKIFRLPEEVLCAGNESVRYIEDGEARCIRRTIQFNRYRFLAIEKVGTFEAYPAGDASCFKHIYGLEGCRTLGRWKLANISTCSTYRHLVDMELLSDEKIDVRNLTYKAFITRLAGASTGKTPHEAVRNKLGLGECSLILRKLDWLGMFDDEPIPLENASPLDILAGRILEKMKYGPRERDMVVLHQECIAEFPGRKKKITCTMVDYGIPGGESAMARTAGLPAAISAMLVLEGRIDASGVVLPVQKKIFDPVLDELARHDITCRQSPPVVMD